MPIPPRCPLCRQGIDTSVEPEIYEPRDVPMSPEQHQAARQTVSANDALMELGRMVREGLASGQTDTSLLHNAIVRDPEFDRIIGGMQRGLASRRPHDPHAARTIPSTGASSSASSAGLGGIRADQIFTGFAQTMDYCQQPEEDEEVSSCFPGGGSRSKPPLYFPDGRSYLLVDTGAVDDLTSEYWATHHNGICNLARNRGPLAEAQATISTYQLPHPKHVGGIGKGVQTCQHGVSFPCGLVDVDGEPWIEQFEGPCILEATLPALFGIEALRRNNALIDCKTGKLWFLGAGGAEIKPSPGSRCFQQVLGPSGHWLLPIHRFQHGAKSKNIAMFTCKELGEGTTPVYATRDDRRTRSAEPVRQEKEWPTANLAQTCDPRRQGTEILSTDLRRNAQRMIRARSCDDATRSQSAFHPALELGGSRARGDEPSLAVAASRGRSSDSS